MSERLSKTASSAAIEHLRWSLTPEVGPILFTRIVERFGSAQQALGVGVDRLQTVDGIGQQKAERIARSCEQADLEQELELAEQYGVRIVCQEDNEYPMPLRYIPDPPVCLYIRGELQATDTVAMAIVGARRCTVYGREQAHRFGYQLADRGMTIISGLARGADSEAHKGALSAKGRNIAVLGNGLANIYPPENKELAERIIQDGALISELPMKSEPEAKNFLPRNRIIAGLSLGVLVVEASKRSGALSTAARASEYNREVFALPGLVDTESSFGTNRLIRDQHAKLVIGPQDIMDELDEVGKALQPQESNPEDPVEEKPVSANIKLSDTQQRIYDAMDHEERTIENIAEETDLSAAEVASTLISLQLKGLVRQLPGNLFMRAGRRR
jgi:DNA processing protein